MEVKYIQHMGSDVMVVNSARTSFNNDLLDKTELTEKDKKLLAYLAKHKHYTPFESCLLTVMVECPIAIRSQIMRHRTASYNEVSRRYTSENIEFYQPNTLRQQDPKSKQSSYGVHKDSVPLLEEYTLHVTKAKVLYDKLIEAGVAKEQARFILPQCTYTRFYMTMNLRNWVHLLSLRLDSHAQEEVRFIALQIKEIMIPLFPESIKCLLP